MSDHYPDQEIQAFVAVLAIFGIGVLVGIGIGAVIVVKMGGV